MTTTPTAAVAWLPPEVDLDARHPATRQLARWFTYTHLPEHLQAVSRPCALLAGQMIASLPDGVELSAGLRKLLEAKDCFVRQALEGATF